MSIEQRLRDGLAANTDVLLPQVDHELGVLLRRATRRRRARVTVAGLAAAAVVAGAGYLTGVATDDQSKSPGPSKDHGLVYGATDMAGINGPLEAGTYAVPMWGENDAADSLPRGVVDVPEGYFSPGGWVVDPGHDGTDEADQHGALAFVYADKIVTDPCAGGPAQQIADTPEALATALTNLPDLRTSTPEPVTIGGHPGLHLKLRTAQGLDLNQCTNDRLYLWYYGEGTDGYYDIASTDIVHHLWILDVDGFRIIMSLELWPDQPPGQNAELLAMAKGARFIDPLSSSE